MKRQSNLRHRNNLAPRTTRPRRMYPGDSSETIQPSLAKILNSKSNSTDAEKLSVLSKEYEIMADKYKTLLDHAVIEIQRKAEDKAKIAALEATIQELREQLNEKDPANIMIHANAEADIKPDIVVKTEPEDT